LYLIVALDTFLPQKFPVAALHFLTICVEFTHEIVMASLGKVWHAFRIRTEDFLFIDKKSNSKINYSFLKKFCYGRK